MNDSRWKLAVFAVASVSASLVWQSDVLAQNVAANSDSIDTNLDFNSDQLFERSSFGSPIRISESHLKHNRSSLRSYRPLIEESRKSTFRVIQDHKQVALATAISTDGYLLTKASEVSDSLNIECRDANSESNTATVVDRSPLWDLAIIKIEASTHPIEWGRNQPKLGSMLVANDTTAIPFSMGTLSVAPRSLKRGFLGIEMQEAGQGVAIGRVVRNSAAERAGLQQNDLILLVDGKNVSSVSQLRKLIGSRRPGDNIKIEIERSVKRLTVEAELAERQTMFVPNVRFGILGMAISKKRTGFPVIQQTDLFVRPDQCGGPLVDLYGNVVGLNIARVDRVTSYSIPSTIIPSLLDVDEKRIFRFAKPLKTLMAELAEVKIDVDNKMVQLKTSMDRYQELQGQIKRAAERN